MRHFLSLLLIITVVSHAAAQSRSLDAAFARLDQHGLSFSLQLYTDTLAGSRVTPTAPSSTAFQYVDLSAGLDLGHLSPRLSGTRAFTSLHVNGSYGADFSGAYQAMAGIACTPGVHFAELWVEHSIGNSALLRLGKIDANPDFAFVESATGFLNATFSYDPTFITLPNYASTDWGSELLLHRGHLRANFAAFSPNNGTGLLFMEEIGTDWQPANWKGRVAFGAWQRTGNMTAFSGLNESGANGAYLVAEQKFWRHERHQGKAEQSLSAYLQLGSAPAEFSTFTRHLGAGLIWTAPLARRDRDSAGFAFTRGRFTNDPAAGFDRRYETVIETYYRIAILKQMSVSPDFQYAFNPGGLSSNRNTYALGARMIFSLSSHAK